MLSSLKIDYIDLGDAGMQPVIKIVTAFSDDPRDKLLAHLLESTGDKDYLTLRYIGAENGSTTVILYNDKNEKIN